GCRIWIPGCDAGRGAPLPSAMDRGRGEMVATRSPAVRLEPRGAAAPRARGVPLGRRSVDDRTRRQPVGAVLAARGLLLLFRLVELDRCSFELARSFREGNRRRLGAVAW